MLSYGQRHVTIRDNARSIAPFLLPGPRKTLNKRIPLMPSPLPLPSLFVLIWILFFNLFQKILGDLLLFKWHS